MGRAFKRLLNNAFSVSECHEEDDSDFQDGDEGRDERHENIADGKKMLRENSYVAFYDTAIQPCINKIWWIKFELHRLYMWKARASKCEYLGQGCQQDFDEAIALHENKLQEAYTEMRCVLSENNY